MLADEFGQLPFYDSLLNKFEKSSVPCDLSSLSFSPAKADASAALSAAVLDEEFCFSGYSEFPNIMSEEICVAPCVWNAEKRCCMAAACSLSSV